jgi:hypothetical protein
MARVRRTPLLYPTIGNVTGTSRRRQRCSGELIDGIAAPLSDRVAVVDDLERRAITVAAKHDDYNFNH